MAQTSSVEETQKKTSNFQNYKRIASYLASYNKSVFALLFVVLFANILMIIGPYLTSVVIDVVIPDRNMPLLIVIIVGYTIVTLLNGWTIRYRQYNISLLVLNVFRDIRFVLFIHMQKIYFSSFNTRPYGKIFTLV